MQLSQQILFLLSAFLPAILPFVRRAAPVVLVVAALLVIVHIVRNKLWSKALGNIPLRPLVLGVCFLTWAGITCLWAPVFARSWQSVATGWLIFVCGICLVLCPLKRDNRADIFMALALSFAALTVVIDLKTGGLLLQLIHSRPEPYRYNMVLVSLGVLSFALFHDSVSLKRPIKFFPVFLLFLAVFASESETAKLSLLVGYLVLFASKFVSRAFSVACFITGVCAAWIIFFLAPYALDDLARLWPDLAERGHAAERLQIWTAYSKFAIAGLPFGWGVESVAYVPMTSFYAGAPELMKPWLDWWHPHNNVIQLAAEMGWPGIVLGFIYSLALVFWAHADDALRPARAGLVSAIVIVCLVSHGFWQMWWWSVVIMALTLLCKAGACLADVTVK
jgi:hypothetical protein